ncbi:MAG: c-type cytochrome [Verrucomicrobiales bacterium]|nr:c-type cytochrome [Verrucomicrobiales bacterium]
MSKTNQQGLFGNRTLLIQVLPIFIYLIWGWAGVRTVRAHPAHAEPVNYPFVVGFERFYNSPLDGEEYLAQGGILLLNELNCVACHAPPEDLKSRLTGRPGTNLAGTGSRLSAVDLEMMIRNPRFVKRDTIMPSLFAGPDRDLAEVEALKHFLVSLKSETEWKGPEGDAEAGRKLYHRIGCVACHAPEKDYRPEDLPESIELELTGLPSIPMNLADKYDEAALAEFLLDPLTHRPSGRMPEFKLTDREAADLAAYLKSGPQPELPPELVQALDAQREFVIDPEKVVEGKRVFVKKQCHVCHESTGQGLDARPVAYKPLSELKLAGEGEERTGCLSERPVGGPVPAFFLDEVQKKAIEGAIRRIQGGEIKPHSTEETIDWELTTMNCYSCHEREGKGGPETAREPYFAVNDPAAYQLGRWGNIPPALDRVGRKFTEKSLPKALAGRAPELRTHLAARMPVFEKDDLLKLLENFRAVDQSKEKHADGMKNGSAERGGEFFTSLGCASCHAEKGAGAEAEAGVVRIPLTAERISALQPAYFRELLLNPEEILPGSGMANVFAGRPNVEQEITDLRAFLISEPEEKNE